MSEPKAVFHPSLEAAQHGDKDLAKLVTFAINCGCVGVQPSNYHLSDPDWNWLTASSIKSKLEERGLRLDGISAHCPLWVHTTAWTESPTVRKFLPADIGRRSAEQIEQWCEDRILSLLDLCAELGVHVVPMFWGVALGWEVATGYPWGMWDGPGFDLVKEGIERFVDKTQKIRDRARERKITLAHEVHPGTAAQCGPDFLDLVEACDGDEVLTVNADLSHCWDGESWQDRFKLVGHRVAGCHVKDHVVNPGMSLRTMTSAWPERPMQFTRLGEGDLDLVRYAQLMYDIGYAERYCNAHGTDTAPLVAEAESAYYPIDDASRHGVQYIKHKLCLPYATTSFEDAMGDQG